MHRIHAIDTPPAQPPTQWPARPRSKPPQERGGWLLAGLAALAALLASASALAQPVLILDPTTVGPLDTEIESSDGTIVQLETAEITVRGTTLTINGRHDIASLVVEGGATVTHDAAFEFDYSGGMGTDVVYGMDMFVDGDIDVDDASSISVSGRGLPSGTGSGTGVPSSSGATGAGHGGNGGANGMAGGSTYGDPMVPTVHGSGGGSGGGAGGAGGGVIRLEAAGRIAINGTVRSDGLNGSGGCCSGGAGGAGGSIWLTAESLTGGGVIRASGGRGHSSSRTSSGGGGGGRILLDVIHDVFEGAVVACGGGGKFGGNRAGAGTIVRRGRLTVFSLDNCGFRVATSDATGPIEVDMLKISGGAVLSSQALVPLNVVAHVGIEIGENSGIDLSGRGHGSDAGPGLGALSACGGAGSTAASGSGFGGNGGDACVAGGSTYGDPRYPEEPGSGGRNAGGLGGSGGGVANIRCLGAIMVDGHIFANGLSGAGGCCGGGSGGSGGSLWISALALRGAGAIAANGGNGHTSSRTDSGGGGGGRIRIDGDSGGFGGAINACGGGGGEAWNRAGAGTVWLSDTRELLVINNCGNARATTDATGPIVAEDIVVSGGARLSAPALTQLQVTVDGDLFVDEFSQINMNGRGFGSAQGEGAGRGGACGPTQAASGGGYGGFGGDACVGGGPTYGSENAPIDFGSGGGEAGGSGGRGGGAARLVVGGTFTLDGGVLADGTNGSGGCCEGGGGGSGGSIWITAQSIDGTGQIRSSGGSGHISSRTNSGGGGGGRIAIESCGLVFDTTRIEAPGVNRGQTGTVYFGLGSLEPSSDHTLACQSGASTLRVVGAGFDLSNFTWARNGLSVTNGPTPWGSTVSGATTSELMITNAQPQDAGLYVASADAACGRFASRAIVLDVACSCEATALRAGIDDGFALPAEGTSPGDALRDALLKRRPSRPFHDFDQVPALTPGVDPDSRLAHTFDALPADIVSARLTMRVRAGGTGGTSPIAEGTDALWLGFATGSGDDARLNLAWQRRFGGTDLNPDLGLLAGELWESGDEALIELDLAALPISAPLGEPGAATISLIADLNTNGYLDLTVVDETGVDFMLLEIETSDGTVFPWAVGPQDASACEGERAEFSATTGGVGGPFTYQWRRDGVAIEPAVNPTAAEATLVLEAVTLDDYASYDCMVSGDNTCGEVTTSSAMLNDLGCCPADFDADGVLTVFDFLAFQNAFEDMNPEADLDGDGEFTLFDFLAFQAAFDAGCA